jgi:hypothetical protein
MSWWLDLAVLAIFVLLLAAMPWKRPHPNHEFMLQMLRLLEDENAEVSSGPSSIGRPGKIDAEVPSPSSETNKRA